MNKKVVIGIIALIVVICVVTVIIVSCNDRNSVVGVYRLDKTTGTEAIVLYEDGTFRSSDYNTEGTWTKKGDEIKLVCTNPDIDAIAYMVGDGVGFIFQGNFWEKIK